MRRRYIQSFNENQDNLNASDIKSGKRFQVIIKGCEEILFSDIINANDVIDATNKAIESIGIENITSYDEVDMDVKEIK